MQCTSYGACAQIFIDCVYSLQSSLGIPDWMGAFSGPDHPGDQAEELVHLVAMLTYIIAKRQLRRYLEHRFPRLYRVPRPRRKPTKSSSGYVDQDDERTDKPAQGRWRAVVKEVVWYWITYQVVSCGCVYYDLVMLLDRGDGC